MEMYESEKVMLALIMGLLAASLLFHYYNEAALSSQLFSQSVVSATGASPGSIQVFYPPPGEEVESPVFVHGKARGRWFFEASFPVRVVDRDGTILGAGEAHAIENWTTNRFVQFKANVNFNKPKFKGGKIILERDNPAELPGNVEKLEIPVLFAPST